MKINKCKLFCRAYQKVMYVGMAFMNWREPKLIKGENSLKELATKLPELGLKRPLIITDTYLNSIKIYAPLTDALDLANIKYTVYGEVVPNPTIYNVADALAIYKKDECDCLIAVGGGSSMDCAKAVGARLARPNKQLDQLQGLLKVRRRIPTLFAVPTTSGTGSEVTVSAVITNPETRGKAALNDLSLIPHYAVLDPTLTYNLPKPVTSTTGMDTLTHAVEAYIGSANTRRTKANAEVCVKLVFDNLLIAYNDGHNAEARLNMQNASYFGGLAFTRAYVGTVHSLAHAIGGFYGVPHGLANAILLPVVLESYGESVHKKLSQLAELVGLEGKTRADKANAFITAIKNMNSQMEIPEKIEGKFKILDEDLEALATHAYNETNPLYPVPKIFTVQELIGIYNKVQ